MTFVFIWYVRFCFWWERGSILMPSISIVVPVYKTREVYLRQCIDSLINQTFKDIEIILVDDGSPDNAGVICDEYAEKDPRIKVIHQQNQGVSVARNVGIEKATGKWITFVDADDFVEHNMCDVIYHEAEKTKVDILIFASYICTLAGREKNSYFAEDYRLFSHSDKEEIELQIINNKVAPFTPKFGSVGWTWGKLYRLDFLKRNRLSYKVGLKRAQDVVFNLHAFERANNILYIDRFLYNYRSNHSSAMNRYIENVWGYFQIVLDEFMDFIKRNNKTDLFYLAYNMKVVSFICEALRNDYFNKQNPKSLKVRLKELYRLLSNETCSTALKNLDISLYGFKTRVLVRLLKHKKVGMLWLIWMLNTKLKADFKYE